MPISGLALARDVQQGLREDLKILVMSATLDGARVAALLGDAPVVESEGRAFPVETRYLGRDPRAPIERQVADAVARGAARGQRLAAGVPAGRRRNPPHRNAAQGAHQRRQRRYRRAVRRARCARAGPRHLAGAARPPQGGAGDLDRGDLAHHRRRARGDRQRPVARAALRARCRPDATGDRARVARRRRPAARPRRPHRAGRLLPAVGRAADRFARALHAAGNPVGRSVVLRARSGAMGREPIRASWRFSIRRRRPRSSEAKSAAARTRRHRCGKAASPRKAAGCARCRCRRGWRAWWSMPARKAPANWPPISPRCSPNADSAATMSILRHRLDQFRRDRSRRAEEARAMVKRWVDTLGAAREGWRSLARRAAGAGLSRPHRQEPWRRRPAASCSPMAAAAWSIRPRRWRASRSSTVAELTGAAAASRIVLAAPITLAEIEARFADKIEDREAVTFDAASASLRARRTRRLGALVLAEQIKQVAPDADSAKQLAEGIAALGIGRLPWSKPQLQLRNRVSCSCAVPEGDEWPDLSDDALGAQRRRMAGAVPDRQDRAGADRRRRSQRRARRAAPVEFAQAARRRGADPFHRAVRLGGADRLRGRAGTDRLDPRAGIVRPRPASEPSPAAACRW